jgi:beta-glucanase (GH16 family)
MLNVKNIFFLLLLSYACTVQAQYNLVWSDEFNGTTLDATKWVHEIGTGCPNLCGWGNNELQYYTSNTDNIKVDTGYLHIIGRRQQFQGSAYTSARIKTEGLYSFQYGKIEARIKVPIGQGLWPAFWMLGSNISTVSWPQCGEIDIMEHINTGPNIYGTIHYNLFNNYNSLGQSTAVNAGQFQIYTVEWDEDAIKWFINGTLYHQVTITNGLNSTEEFHNPFFLLLNMAMGGNWPGAPNASTPAVNTMLVDYVRVYQKPSTGANVVDFDANNNWTTYMNVFETPANGGGYVFGSNWALGDAKSTLNTNIGTAGTLTLQPNFNTYRDNSSDAYWVNQTTGEGNKVMEASTYVEPGATYLGADFTFTGSVVSYTLDSSKYQAKVFIKALDPANGYADALGGTKVMDLPPSGNFSITADSADLTSGLVLQYGFFIRGVNANPVDEAALGSVVIGESIVNTNVSTVREINRAISIYPNPTQDILTVVAKESIDNYRIIDISGKVVLTGNNPTTIDVSALKTGTYFVEFFSENGKAVKSFVKL